MEHKHRHTEEEAHADVPVNTYKPKNFSSLGTVTDNYSLLKDGAIGRVQHITFDLSAADPGTQVPGRAEHRHHS